MKKRKNKMKPLTENSELTGLENDLDALNEVGPEAKDDLTNHFPKPKELDNARSFRFEYDDDEIDRIDLK